jgi:hypothetical protein
VHYYGYRYYNPELGRWPSRDPIGEAGTWNNYAFVENRPLDFIDLLGLLSESIVNSPEFIASSLCSGSGVGTAGFRASGGSLEFTKWVPGPAETDGYIVQKVTTKWIYSDCDGNIVDQDEDVFWEAWRVDGGVVKGWGNAWTYVDYDKDQLYYSAAKDEVCGYKAGVTIRYEAGFHTGSLAAGFAQAGKLMKATSEPSFWGGLSKQTSKYVGYTFRCCCCEERKRTLSWHTASAAGGALIESDISGDNTGCCK